ncbi:MAG: type II secretion system F family protein [Acidimicrobiia bacterium]
MSIITALFFTCLVSITVYKFLAPYPSLSSRISPYDSIVKVRLNKKITNQNKPDTSNGRFFIEFFSPVVNYLSSAILKFTKTDNKIKLETQLKQAGIAISAEKYRVKIIKQIFITTSIGILIGASVGNITSLTFFSLLFCFIGITKSKTSLEKMITRRKDAIRQELFTINQLLSIYIKTGSGVIQAITNVTNKTSGEVSNDLKGSLDRVKTGSSIEDSLRITAENTPEPYASRTYKLLASASNRGVDLTVGLMDLANDLKRSLRDDLKASSTKKRAAMLIPTIGILAPIMLLFVAAPIPSIVLAGR